MVWRRRMRAHLLLPEPPNHQLLNNHWQEDTETHQKRCLHPRTRRICNQAGRRGTIMIKPNPILTRWATLKLGNSNTEEVLLLLWRFWAPHQAPQPEDQAKGLGLPREYDFERPVAFDCRTSTGLGKQRLHPWWAQSSHHREKPVHRPAREILMQPWRPSTATNKPANKQTMKNIKSVLEKEARCPL